MALFQGLLHVAASMTRVHVNDAHAVPRVCAVQGCVPAGGQQRCAGGGGVAGRRAQPRGRGGGVRRGRQRRALRPGVAGEEVVGVGYGRGRGNDRTWTGRTCASGASIGSASISTDVGGRAHGSDQEYSCGLRGGMAVPWRLIYGTHPYVFKERSGGQSLCRAADSAGGHRSHGGTALLRGPYPPQTAHLKAFHMQIPNPAPTCSWRPRLASARVHPPATPLAYASPPQPFAIRLRTCAPNHPPHPRPRTPPRSAACGAAPSPTPPPPGQRWQTMGRPLPCHWTRWWSRLGAGRS